MVTLNIASTTRWLWRAVGFLSAMNLLFIVLNHGFHLDWVLGLARAFRTDHEQNIPTWYSVCTLGAAALLLLAVGEQERRHPRRYAPHWLALGLIFFALSLDELMLIHEDWGYVISHFFPRHFEHRAWNVLYVAPLLAFAAAYWRFWNALDSPTKRGLCLAGGLYVGGAFGVEFIENYLFQLTQSPNLGSDLASSVEEAMEMSGVVVLIRTLLERLAGGNELTLRIE